MTRLKGLAGLLAVLIGIALLLSLGFWQLDRRAWKRDLIASIEERSNTPPIALPGQLEEVPDLEFLRAEAGGVFDHEQELYLVARTLEGKVGFHVLTPLKLGDGRLLLVDRGWVPPELKLQSARAESQLQGRVLVTGLLRSDGWKGQSWIRPDNRPEQNEWLYIDLDAMAEAIGRPDLTRDYYLQSLEGSGGEGYPRAVPSRSNIRDDHLQYALTWFALAIALVAIYVICYRRRSIRLPNPKS